MSVAQSIKIRGHGALLVREDWLQRALQKTGLTMVFRWLGQKQLFETDKVVGSWLEINAVASLKQKQWTFEKRRLNFR